MLPTGTVTFLFSDIEGSTRLVQELGPTMYREVLERHQSALREAFRSHDGVERGTEGDSFFVVFPEAASAIAAAVDGQRALDRAEWPAGAVVRARMGLHTGTARPGGDDYVGIDVNRAARIAAVGHGGQVLLSEATRALGERELPTDVSLRDLGEHGLKDLVRPERIYQLIIAGLPADFPPLNSMTAAKGDIPARLTSFVGRRAELEELHRLIGGTRLLTVTGPGGTGKTSLATEFAREIGPSFGDGAWFVPLEAIGQADLVASSIVAALDLTDGGSRAPQERLRDHLRDRTLLLVLDNFEQVLPAAALVGDLLAAARNLKVVVTSRAPLHLGAEQEYPLAPLPLPAASADIVDPAALESFDSIRLFVDRAKRVLPSFVLSTANAASVAEICRRLDGLPLAIELAASRVKLFSPQSLAAGLVDRLGLLTGGSLSLPERQRTLRTTIDWSYQLLGQSEQQLLDRLSVFAGGWTLEAAEAVCNPGSELGIGTVDGLTSLIDGSLVRPVEAGLDEGRFGMLDTIRQYAHERLVERGEEGDVRRRHAQHVRALAEATGPHLVGDDQAAWLERLEREIDNLRASLEWALHEPDTETGLRSMAAVWRFWTQSGRLAEGRAFLDRLLATPDAALATRMRGLWAAGGIAYWQGDAERTASCYEEALSIARTIGEREFEVEGLYNLAFARLLAGDHAATERLLLDSRRLAEELDRPDQAATADVALAMLYVDNGDHDAAIERAEGALEVLRGGSERLQVQYALAMVGQAYRLKGDLTRAARYFLEALRLAPAGDRTLTARRLLMIAGAVAAMGKHRDALVLWGASMAIYDEMHVVEPLALAAWRVEDVVAAARTAIGEAATEAALEEGRRLGREDALALAERLLRA